MCPCLQAVPKLLWQLGTTKPATSKVALHMLHSVLKVAPAGSALSAVLDKLQLQLCPLWGSLLDRKVSLRDQKGASQSPAAAEKDFVNGPLAQLPEDTQVGIKKIVSHQWYTGLQQVNWLLHLAWVGKPAAAV